MSFGSAQDYTIQWIKDHDSGYIFKEATDKFTALPQLDWLLDRQLTFVNWP